MGANGGRGGIAGLSAVVVCCATGCFYPAGRGKLLEQRIEQMERDRTTMEAGVEARLAKIEHEATKKVGEVSRALEMLDRSARKTGAGLDIEVQRLQGDLSALQGAQEQGSFRIAQLEAQLQSLKSEPPAPATPSAPPPAPAKLPADKEAALKLVETTLQEDLAKGEALGNEWLKKWSGDPLAVRAMYALGSAYHSAQRWGHALSELQVVAERYPTSPQAPAALLKAVDCFVGLKMHDAAKLSLQELVRNYPTTQAGKTAQARLSKMK